MSYIGNVNLEFDNNMQFSSWASVLDLQADGNGIES